MKPEGKPIQILVTSTAVKGKDCVCDKKAYANCTYSVSGDVGIGFSVCMKNTKASRVCKFFQCNYRD